MTDAALPPLIRALLQPQCYTHPVGDVELLQTHLSWVLLAGEYAYKIKKPVKFDFVDFSTLERRRSACVDELRLNRRFAASLYLEVLPITRCEDAVRFGGEGAPVEYAVQLRRFAQSELLTALLEQRAVDADSLERFGAQLADIHAASTDCSAASAPEQTLRTAEANARELEALDRSKDVQQLCRWARTEAAGLEALVRARHRAGRVRECHGDLHAGNIVRLEGELTAFDCIEFNQQLRCIDVWSDAAFLYMDLLARGAPRLAYAFLNGWLECGGDYDGAPLLRFLATYRALVRAKVALLSGDPATSERYRTLAQSLTRARRPTLVLMCGLSGSGKTWFSRELFLAGGGIRVRSDVERKRLAGLRAHESSRAAAPDLYSLAMNTRVYDVLLAHARTVLQSGEHAIIDAAFLKREERLMFLALARELNAHCGIVHCIAAPEELRRRLRERERAGRDASEATIAVMEQQREFFESFTTAESPYVIEVTTDEAGGVSRAAALLS